MLCPACKHASTRVLDSRDIEDNRAIRRRRECEQCGNRFTTYERLELGNLTVVKKDGSREFYDRAKVEKGIWRSLEKRPVTIEQVKALVDGIEEKWRNGGKNEIPSTEIGSSVMDGLRKLDEVAYIRFASVYREFKDVDEFKKELGSLFKKEQR